VADNDHDPSAPKAKVIERLESHPEPYVTVGELAAYWLVSRKMIYKQIDAGTLVAIRLGPRLLRIRTADALDFEKRAQMGRPAPAPAGEPETAEPNAERRTAKGVSARARRS
jgi:excisionase family DNA binding protein